MYICIYMYIYTHMYIYIYTYIIYEYAYFQHIFVDICKLSIINNRSHGRVR